MFVFQQTATLLIIRMLFSLYFFVNLYEHEK